MFDNSLFLPCIDLNISTQEKDALVAIYNATQGDNWTQSWDLNTDVTAWQGLTIKETIDTLSGTIGEKMGVKDLAILAGETVASYSHLVLLIDN